MVQFIVISFNDFETSFCHPCELNSVNLADNDQTNSTNLFVDCWTLMDNFQNLSSIICTRGQFTMLRISLGHVL